MPQQSKKKGRKPAHQNTFAFKHNPKSKLTEKILASPNVGVCRRCYDKIEWRKQYRKYKPLSQPSSCNLCKRRNITAAYHTICNSCSKSPAAWKKMNASKNNQEPLNKPQPSGESATMEDTRTHKQVCCMCCKEEALPDLNDSSEIDQEIDNRIAIMEQKLGRPLKLRETKAIERKVVNAKEAEKKRLKEERRRIREGVKAECIDDAHSDEDDDECPLDRSHHDGGEDLSDEDSISDRLLGTGNESLATDDPFLKAVGGKDKLLTGEAFQKMRLLAAGQKQ